MKRKKTQSGQKRKKSWRWRLSEREERAEQHFSEHFLKRLKNVREVRLWVTEWVLLVFAVFLLAAVQILWYGDAHETTAFTDGGMYSEAVIGKINTLNPLFATTEAEKTVSRLLFANLTAPDASGHEKGELLKSLTMDETGKVWVAELKEGLKWSDGEPITATDVIYTVELLKNPDVKTASAVDFYNITLEKLDDRQVKFVLPSVYTDFADSLDFPLLPEHILREVKPALLYENEFSTNPVGSGPFVINAIQEGGVADGFRQAVYLNRNERYFKARVRLDNLVLKLYDAEDAVVKALAGGDVNGTGALSPLYRDDFDKTRIGRRTSLLNGGAFAFLNTARLKDKALREGIRCGINLQAIRETLGDARDLDFPILKRQVQGIQFPELPDYSVNNAKKAFLEAGLAYRDGKLMRGDEQVTLDVAARKYGVMTQVAEKFRDELEKLGFAVNLRLIDDAQTETDLFRDVIRPRAYDILLYEVDLGVSADPFVYFSSTQANGAGWNFSNYRNEMADDALLSARMTTDENLKKAKYNLFLKYFVADTPAIGLFQSSLDYYYASDMRIFAESLTLTDASDRFTDVAHWAVKQKRVQTTP